MIPGEIVTPDGEIALNEAQKDQIMTITVANQGDRPIQVGSHFHFLEVNDALAFYQSDENQNLIQIDRKDAHNPTRGMRLNIPAGTAVRFEPGDYQKVELVPFAGKREIYGFNGKIDGPLEV